MLDYSCLLCVQNCVVNSACLQCQYSFLFHHYEQSLATALWTLNVAQNAPLPRDQCDTSKANVIVLSACSHYLSGYPMDILTYNVQLPSCKLQSNYTVRSVQGRPMCVLLPPQSQANMLVPGKEGPVTTVSTVGQWVDL